MGILFFVIHKRRQRRNALRPETVVQAVEHDGTPGTYMPSPYQGINVRTWWQKYFVSDLATDSTGFPSPPQYGAGFGSDKSFGYPHSPGQIHQEDRSPSVAPSWLSGTTNGQGHGQGHKNHPSVSSMGSSQGGLHFLYNQQRSTQQLNTVSEMENTQVSRPISELPGSVLTGQQGDVYELGYTKVPAGSPR